MLDERGKADTWHSVVRDMDWAAAEDGVGCGI